MCVCGSVDCTHHDGVWILTRSTPYPPVTRYILARGAGLRLRTRIAAGAGTAGLLRVVSEVYDIRAPTWKTFAPPDDDTSTSDETNPVM